MKETKSKYQSNRGNFESHRAFIRMNGRLISKSFSRKTDADRWYCEMKRQKELIESGLKTELQTSTLRNFSESWLASRRSNGQPLSSYQQEEARLRLYILPVFGTRGMETIGIEEWEQFLDGLIPTHGLGPATRNRIRALLSKMYNDARRKKVVEQNPISIIPKLKEKAKKWDYWQTSDECARYLKVAETEGIGFKLFAYLALNTGARIGEIMALTSHEIDLERRRLRIWRIVEAASGEICERTKGFTERWLGINDSLIQVLTCALESKPEIQLLISGDAVRSLDHRTLRAIHLRVCKRAGVRPIRIHDLRHTFASHYVMNGGSLAELQGLLGHTSPTMTLKYAHLAPGFLESKAKVVSFTAYFDPKMKLVVSR
ncbi:MAG: tyrosine-type recombinase/integrase [Bdellovibrionales bacterium]